MARTMDEILDVLRIRRFATLAGARGFVFGPDYVSFRLSSYIAKKGINEITIQETVGGDYDILFIKARTHQKYLIAVERGTPRGLVQSTLSRITGLRPS